MFQKEIVFVKQVPATSIYVVGKTAGTSSTAVEQYE